MIAQMDLFAAPVARATPPPAPPAAARGALSANGGTAAERSTPAPAQPGKAKRGKEPPAPPVVIAEPQLPPLGALAKINGHWHVWRKDGLTGAVVGWGIVRPEHHSAHAKDTPPSLDKKGWINEPHPAPATLHMDGAAVRFEWSEHGFSAHHGERFLLHFRALAACAIGAAEIARADPQFQTILAALKEPAPEREETPPLHPLHQALIDADLIGTYHAVNGATFQDPKHKDREAPWNAPSRLFLFPCALHLPKDEQPRLLIWTERLAEHPYVREVVRVTGLEPEVDDGGFDAGFHASHKLYHHAVDLISEGQWQQLLDLRDFTDTESIVSAVNYGLTYAHLKPREALAVLKAIAVDKPTNPGPVDALRVCSLSEFKNEQGKTVRAVNFMHGPGSEANVWALLAGIERGWFTHDRSGFMRWTDKALIEQRNLKAAAGEDVAPAPVPEGCLL